MVSSSLAGKCFHGWDWVKVRILKGENLHSKCISKPFLLLSALLGLGMQLSSYSVKPPTGLIPWCGKGFFSQSTFSADSLTCVHAPPFTIACNNICTHVKDPVVHVSSEDYGNIKTPSMHDKLGSMTLLQQSFLRESDPIFPREKSQWDNTIVKKEEEKNLNPEICLLRKLDSKQVRLVCHVTGQSQLCDGRRPDFTYCSCWSSSVSAFCRLCCISFSLLSSLCWLLRNTSSSDSVT